MGTGVLGYCTWVQVCGGTVPGYRCVRVLYLGTSGLGTVPGYRWVKVLYLATGGLGHRTCVQVC